jgi:hypothetical protein
MVKESLIAILKESSCYIVISLVQDFVAGRHLRAWYDARCARHRYGDAFGEKWILWRSQGVETIHLGGKKGNGILFNLFFVLAWAELPKQTRKISLTEQANRGNVKDCFDPLGTKSSPRRVRVSGSPMATSAAVSLPEALASCGQNTALATLETNVLLLRRVPRSSAASEPTAMVRRRHKLGALANMSSAAVSVPWRVRNRGIGELLANVNWCSVTTVSWTK